MNSPPTKNARRGNAGRGGRWGAPDTDSILYSENVATQAARSPFLEVGELAEMLGCSCRTVYRRADAGLIPPGVKLGGHRRWNRAQIHQWISAGCPRMKGGRP
jgi:excisionase family DNA binding protein